MLYGKYFNAINEPVEFIFERCYADRRMKLVKIRFLFCALIMAVVACPHPHGSSGMIPASAQRIFRGVNYEKVWSAALAVLTEDLELPLDEVIPENGLVSTKWVTYKRRAGDSQESNRASAGASSPMLVEYRVVVLVKISPEGTMVRARCYKREFKQRWTSVPTDLAFERQYLNLVAARLGVY